MVATRPGDDPTPRAGEGGPRRTTAQLAADPAFTGTYAPLAASKFGTRRALPRPDQIDPVIGTAPTVAALASATAITSPVTFKPVGYSGGSGALQVSKFFTFTQAGTIAMYGTSSPDFNYVTSNSITGVSAAVKMPSIGVEFWYSGAGALEILLKEITGWFRVWIDGQLVSTTPTTIANTGGVRFLPITFAGRGQHRIKFETTGVFGGVNIGPTDSIWAAQVHGPRVVVIGDSYTAGTGATGGGASNWVRKLAAAMGWADVWSSGVGGTGYLQTAGGSTTTFRGRLATDVIPFAPDLIVWAGGHNDTGFSAAAVQAEAALCFSTIAAALPNCRQVVQGVMWNSGVEALTAAVLDTDTAIQAAAVAAGLPFIPFVTGETDNAGTATTLASTASSGATTISVASVFVPVGGTIEIDTGAARERRTVKTSISGVGPYTYTLNKALSATHASGTTVRAVGPNFWTGTGSVAGGVGPGIKGDGNCDVIVSNDGTHPSQEGHDQIGMYAAGQIARLLTPA